MSKQQPSTDDSVPAEVEGVRNETTVEEVRSTSAIIGNIPETFGLEFLEMLVENILKDCKFQSATKPFTIEVIPDTTSAVVTFHSEKGTH